MNGTVYAYGNSFEPGWAVLSLGSGGIQQQQVAGAVSNISKHSVQPFLPVATPGVSDLNCDLAG